MLHDTNMTKFDNSWCKKILFSTRVSDTSKTFFDGSARTPILMDIQTPWIRLPVREKYSPFVMDYSLSTGRICAIMILFEFPGRNADMDNQLALYIAVDITGILGMIFIFFSIGLHPSQKGPREKQLLTLSHFTESGLYDCGWRCL